MAWNRPVLVASFLAIFAVAAPGYLSPWGERPGQAQERPAPRWMEPAPFEMAYAPAKAIGVFACRPAAIFTQPEMRQYAPTVDEGIKRAMALFRTTGGGQAELSILEIEQIVGGVLYRYDHRQPEGSRNQLLSTVAMVRTTRPYDWRNLLQILAPGGTEQVHRGKTYYRWPAKIPGIPGPKPCAYVPDERTIVLATEEDLHEVLERGSDYAPPYVWKEGWASIARNHVAIALDGRNAGWLKEMPLQPGPEESMAATLLRLLAASQQAVFGCQATRSGVEINARVRCATPFAAERLALDLSRVRAAAGSLLDLRTSQAASREQELKAYQFAQELVNNWSLGLREDLILMRTETQVPPAEVLALEFPNRKK